MGCVGSVAAVLPEWVTADSDARTERVRSMKENLSKFEGVLQRKITSMDAQHSGFEDAARRHALDGRRGLALINVQSMDQCALDIARYASRHQAICRYVSLMDRVLVSDEFLSQLQDVRTIFREASGKLVEKEDAEGDRVQDETFDLENILQDLDIKVSEIVKSPGNREDFDTLGEEDEERLTRFMRDMAKKHGDDFEVKKPAIASAGTLQEATSSEVATGARSRQNGSTSVAVSAATTANKGRREAANLLVDS